MNALKGIGGFLLAIAMVAAFSLFIYALIYGAAYASMLALPIMGWAVFISIATCLFLFVPLSFFHKTRLFSATGFLLASYVFGLCTWMIGLLVTLQYWGVFAVLLGFLIAGIGVVPIGMLAAAFNGSWGDVLSLFVGLFATYGVRALSLRLGQKHEIEEERRRSKIIEGTVLR